MVKRNIIVIGASAGGLDAIRTLTANLPRAFPAAIFIVWHMSPHARGVLPQELNKQRTLKAAHAVDGEPIRNGRIYVAPPDHHLLLEENRIRVTHGPRENRFRPAIDPLFRSAAFVYRSRVVGIVLSGALDDGSAGLWTIKEYGGIAIVQDPQDAEVSSMPMHAIRSVRADYVVPVAEMSSLLTTLVGEPVMAGSNPPDRLTSSEINFATGNNDNINMVLELGVPTPYTCPECHGALVALGKEGLMRFRCHTGHAFTGDSLLSAISEKMEETLWNSLRTIQESVLLLNHMGDHYAEENQPKLAAVYFKKAKEAEARAKVIRQTISNHERLDTDQIHQEANEGAVQSSSR
jgi:two-component system chemotaxis response regulator CheB